MSPLGLYVQRAEPSGRPKTTIGRLARDVLHESRPVERPRRRGSLGTGLKPNGVLFMSKGTRREREAAELYKRAGFAVYRPATVQFGENDVFGLFDLLAVSPSHESVRAVQVKSNRAAGVRAWMRHTALWRRLGWVTEYLVPHDKEGWQLIHPNGDTGSWRTAFDERSIDDLGPHRDTDLCIGDGLAAYLRSGEL